MQVSIKSNPYVKQSALVLLYITLPAAANVIIGPCIVLSFLFLQFEIEY